MLMSIRHGFGFIGVPKCATSSVVKYLRPHCDTVLAGHPGLKHLSVQAYERHILPLLLQSDIPAPSLFAVVRHPVDWMRSRYTFRARPALADPAHPRHGAYTGAISFDAFVEGILAGDGGITYKGHDQSWYLTRTDGSIGVDTLFTTENVNERLPDYLRNMGLPDPGPLPRRNRSPKGPAPQLSPANEAALLDFLQRDLVLFETYR